MTQNYINHIALVLDASYSMKHRTRDLIKVADEQVKYLARRSQELDQETRVTVYSFDDRVKCLVWDKDVLRLPSIAELYHADGNTALIDATLQTLADFALITEKYGDHAFLAFVLTDGEENRSRQTVNQLTTCLNFLADNVTVAVLVPDQRGLFEAKRFGFPKDNIAIWDTTTSEGLVEAGETIRRATDSYMVNRASGLRGSRSLFSTGAEAVNKETVAAAGLKALAGSKYRLVPVPREAVIRPFIEECGFSFKVGCAYYQLTKTETIQGNKEIAVVEKKSDKVYIGQGARSMLGLGGDTVRVKPNQNQDYDIYVESTSVNRKLLPGTKLLVMM